MVYPCKCVNEFQDKLYGKGKRVYNVGKVYKTCTICGNKVPVSDSDKKSSKKEE